MQKLAILTTHPIQYNAPWFRLLAERDQLQLKVFYTWSQAKDVVQDKTFGKAIKWDIPLLEGYDYEFVENVAKQPGSHHYKGISNPDLIHKIKAFQPDAILVFGWKFKSHLKAIRHFYKKIPVWFRGDSTLLDNQSSLKGNIRRLVLTKVYSYIDRAFYVGMANKQYFLNYGLQPHQLVYAPHAIDNKRFMSEESNTFEKEAQQWRQGLGFGLEDIVILFAGKFESKKQPDFLLNAFLKAKKENIHPIKLLFVGNGPLESQLKAHDDPDVRFLSFQNQSKMPIIYRVADVLCLPSKGPGETWGLAVNEAMACSRPVITSNKVGCAQDLIDNGKTGFTFQYNEVEALEVILTQLTKSSIKDMGKNANHKIQKFNFEAIIDAIITEMSRK